MGEYKKEDDLSPTELQWLHFSANTIREILVVVRWDWCLNWGNSVVWHAGCDSHIGCSFKLCAMMLSV